MVTAMIWCAAWCVSVAIMLATHPVPRGDIVQAEFVGTRMMLFHLGIVLLALLATLYVNGVGS